jgi:TonB-linked SusC/RagA family outer membrane protein
MHLKTASNPAPLRGLLSKTLLVMKLTAFLMLVVCLHVSATGLSQRISISVKNVPVQQVLKEITRQTGVSFVYKESLFKGVSTVNINVKDATLQEVLNLCFHGQPLEYLVKNGAIVVRSRPAARVKYPDSPPVMEQAKTIHGKIVDDHGQPMTGVTVSESGSSSITITDAKGEYEISLKNPKQAILVFSYVGFQTVQIKVGDKEVIDISLSPNAAGLNEIVVVGYGTRARKDLTSAITTVNTQLLENRSLTNLSGALEGLTPGVYINQQNGRPGLSGASFDIRGASLSTFSSNPPLVIIDGVVDNIDDVNPADVDKISILKDAAASAIYGARATGGVVLITTKSGSAGKLGISYNGMTGFQRQPYGDLKFVNTATWMKANNEAAESDGSPDIFSQADIAKYTNSKDPQFPESTQWTSWISKTAPQQSHNISLRGGNGPLSFYLSGGLLKQDGFMTNDNYTRKNVLLNLNYRPSSRLEISTNFAYLRNDQTQAGVNYNGGLYGIIRNAVFTPPNEPLYNPDGSYNNNVIWGSSPAYNEKYGGDAIGTSDNFRMSFSLKYEILKGLNLNITTAAKLFYSTSNTLNPKIPFLDAGGNILGYNVSNVAVSEGWGKSNYVNNQFLLDYKKRIGKHNFQLMGGITYEDQTEQAIGASASQFPNNEIREIAGSTGSGSQISGTSSADEWAINSVIGRLNYDYADKYLFESTIRYDGSSRFSPDKRWGVFPSFSAAWRVKQESFLKDINILSDLKLRASWGQLGNEGDSLYPYAQRVSFGSGAVFGNGLVKVATLGNPVDFGLSWEKKTTENIGLDFGFLNNRLSGSFDYFKARTSNIIGTPPVPSTFGAGAPFENIYTIDTRGFELELKWKDRIGQFRYFAGFNLSNSVDNVINLSGLGSVNPQFGSGRMVIAGDGNTFMEEGKAQGQWYLIKTDGLFVSQDQIDKSATQTSLTRPGDIHYLDGNGDGKIDPNDRVPLGKTSTPHYFFGLNLGVEFKNFDLSAVINGVWEHWNIKTQGGSYLVGVRPDLDLLQTNYDNRWTAQNPDKNAKEPRLTQDNWIGTLSNITQPSQYQLASFRYVRLKNLQVGYTLPGSLTQRLSIAKARIYFSAENLFTYKPGYIESIDPESNPGFDVNASTFFGPVKLINFGINVTF